MPIEAAMGPVSILTIAEVVATSITELVNLKLRDRSVPLQVSTLVGQLHIVQVALEQILSWTSEDLLNSQRYQQLVAQIEGSLGSFCPLILALQEHLDRLSLRDQGDMTARSKVSFFWNEKDLASYSSLLDRQANALSLFLQAVQCRTLAEQQRIIDEKENQAILQKARDCSSSIIELFDDDASIFSEGNINSVGLKFDFDAMILGSRACISAHQSNMKREILPNIDPPPYSPTSLSNVQHRPSSLLQEGSLQNIGTRAQKEIGETSVNSEVEQQSLTSNSASVATGHALTSPFKGVVVPGSALLRSLRDALRIRMTNQAELEKEDAFARNQQIEALLAREREQTKVKLLILGPGQSGKSTLVQGTRIILDSMEEQGIPLQDTIKHHAQAIMNEDIHDIGPEFCYSTELQAAITQLWADRGFKEAYNKCRFEYPIYDNLQYFVDHTDRLASPECVPTHEDMLRARIRTFGATELIIPKGDVHFQVFEVGGVRCERRKWIHTFEGVDALVFTIDALAYAQFLPEDRNTTMMTEQLLLWESIANSSLFVNSKLVLVFTKIDLLPEVLRLRPPTNFLADFKEPEPGDKTRLIDFFLGFIADKFLLLIRDEKARQRAAVIFADLVHLDDHNPTDAVLEAALE